MSVVSTVQSVNKIPNPPRTRPRPSLLTFFDTADPLDPVVDDDPVARDPAAELLTVAGPSIVTMQSLERTPLGQQPLGSQ